jgi:hypothetical protein
MKYYISQICDSSVSEMGEFGDFRIVKYYDIYKTAKLLKLCDDVNGIIVQKVTRTTHCGPFKDSSYLTTSDEIDEFTNGHVLSSNISYYEYFDVENGKSLYGDAFASGAITKYQYSYPILKSLPYTNGETSYSGKSVFIHEDNSIFSTITSLNWDTNSKSPANNLPFIMESDESNKFFKQIFYNRVNNKFKNSNIATHNLTATWSEKKSTTKVVQTL